MSNHILHPIGDRTLCEPHQADFAAPHVSTDPATASCPDCVAAYERARTVSLALAIEPGRVQELEKRARQSLARHREGDLLDPDAALALTPLELLALFQELSDLRARLASEAPPTPPAGVLPSKTVPHGHLEIGPVVTPKHEAPGVRAGEENQPSGTPAFTPYPGNTLKPDNNYDFTRSDRLIDELARTEPHGKVVQRPDGFVAECLGAPACGVCRREEEIVAVEGTHGVVPFAPALPQEEAPASPAPSLGLAIQELMADPEVTKQDLLRALVEGGAAALSSGAQDSTPHYNKKAD